MFNGSLKRVMKQTRTKNRTAKNWLTLIALISATPAFAGQDLISIYQTAKQSDPQFRAAAAERMAALETKNQSRAGYYPQLDLSVSKTQSDTETTVSNVTTTRSSDSTGYTLSLVQPLYNRNTYVSNRQADATVDKAEINYQNAEQALVLRVSQAYFNVLAAIDNLEFARAEKSAIERQLEQTKQRFNVGLIAITDVHESQAAYDTAVASEISAENRLNIGLVTLEEITGQANEELVPLNKEPSLVIPEPADIKQWVERAKENNLQLQALKKDLKISQQQIESARSDHYPTLNLVGSHSYTDKQNFGTSVIEDSTSTTISLQLDVPLYHGGITNSQVRQSQHQYTQAKEGFEQQRRAIERETRSAYLDVMAGISRVNALQQALVSSQSALEATEAGLEVGTRTTVDVLAARREMFRAQSNLSQAKYDYILNTLRLKSAAGILSEADLEPINSWLK